MPCKAQGEIQHTPRISQNQVTVHCHYLNRVRVTQNNKPIQEGLGQPFQMRVAILCLILCQPSIQLSCLKKLLFVPFCADQCFRITSSELFNKHLLSFVFHVQRNEHLHFEVTRTLILLQKRNSKTMLTYIFIIAKK